MRNKPSFTIPGSIQITIPGKPIAKKRPRFARRGKFVTTYNDQETEEGKFIVLVMEQIKSQIPALLETAISLHCEFVFELPAAAKKSEKEKVIKGEQPPHLKKPDLDNLIKFVKDCLNQVVWRDDSLVNAISARKYYGKSAKTYINIYSG